MDRAHKAHVSPLACKRKELIWAMDVPDTSKHTHAMMYLNMVKEFKRQGLRAPAAAEIK
jgi:hypothetical protein